MHKAKASMLKNFFMVFFGYWGVYPGLLTTTLFSDKELLDLPKDRSLFAKTCRADIFLHLPHVVKPTPVGVKQNRQDWRNKL